jgi:hypothetical protein
MFSAASDCASASPPKCGWRRDFGTVRMSPSRLIPCACSSAMKSSSERVECPIVKMVA